MSFLSPWMLIGLAAFAIPPILHLLLRQKPKRVQFSALEFILSSQRKTARRFRLRQITLMILRSLLLALLALALARPLLVDEQSDAQIQVSQGGAVVVVLDASYTMQYRLDEDALFDKARRMAGDIMAQPGLQGAVILAGQTVVSPFDELTADLSSVRKYLTEVDATTGAGQLNEAVGRAYTLLSSAPGKKTVVVLTTRAGAAEISPPPIDGPMIELNVVDVAESRPTPNRAVTGVQVRPAPNMGMGHWQIVARIANHGDDPEEKLPISLLLDGELSLSGFVDVPANAEAVKSFYLPIEQEAPVKATVRLKNDDLPIDDELHFWMEPAPVIKILAINGDPNPTPYLDELFYLRNIIEPAVASGAHLRMMSVELENVEALRLDDHDTVVLANVSQLPPKLSRSLNSFVRGGGGLMISMGENVMPRQLNDQLGALLPRTLRTPRAAGDAAASREGGDRRVGRISSFSEEHPITSQMLNLESSSLKLAEVEKYMLLDPAPTAGGQVAMSLETGEPFFLTKSVGEGRVVLLTTTLDREWSDLAIRPHFLPLMVHTLQYLAQSRPLRQQVVTVGQSVHLELPDSRQRKATVRSPAGEVYVSEKPKDSEDIWKFEQTTEIGHYAVTGRDELERRVLNGFSVQVDPSAGNLNGRALTSLEDSDREAQATVAQRTELWHYGLMFLFLLLLMEGLVLISDRRLNPVSQETS